jgi:hypothetical protein
VLRDIRELKDDPAAYAAEFRRCWTGLPLWQAFGASRRDDGHWVLPELVGVQPTLHDEGSDNRMVTSASAVFEIRA